MKVDLILQYLLKETENKAPNEEIISKYEQQLAYHIEEAINYNSFYILPTKNLISILSQVDFSSINISLLTTAINTMNSDQRIFLINELKN